MTSKFYFEPISKQQGKKLNFIAKTCYLLSFSNFSKRQLVTASLKYIEFKYETAISVLSSVQYA